jgi:hypothetical protein
VFLFTLSLLLVGATNLGFLFSDLLLGFSESTDMLILGFHLLIRVIVLGYSNNVIDSICVLFYAV